MRTRPAWLVTIRADQWWTFKLVPPVTAIYAVRLGNDVPIVANWPQLVAVLIALGSGAAAISLINDVFDRRDDRAAGKTNRLERAGYVTIALLLLPHVLVASFMGWWWHREVPILLVYAATWLSFLLYSVPPVRLKRRGAGGVLADAVGASMLPVMLAATVAGAGKGDPLLLIVLATWSMAYGVRGIVWHQLEDADNDRRSGISTYVVKVGPGHARLMIQRRVFPAEVAGILALIALGPLIAALVLCLYLRTVGPMKGHYGRRPTVIAATPQTVPLLFDFYVALLPPILLLESTFRHPHDAIVMGLHLIIFAPGWLPYVREIWHWRKR
jgi:4-hydroxybenzoate polyprenyltransferase